MYGQGTTALYNNVGDTYLYDVFTGSKDIKNATVEVNEGLFVVGSDTRLYNIDPDLNALETLLKRLEKAQELDYVIIDLPPALSTNSLVGLYASDCVIIPTEAEVTGIKAFIDVAEQLNNLKGIGKEIKVSGVLINNYYERINIYKQLKENIEQVAGELFGDIVIGTARHSSLMARAHAFHTTVISMYPNEKITKDYINFFERIGL